MTRIILDPSARADQPRFDAARADRTHEVAGDIAYKRLGIVNVVYFGNRDGGRQNWVLIDAGLPGTPGMIRRAALARFGEGARPAAIVMTHAHADHAGGLETLAREWQVPIYAHELELPYLNGTAAYPPPDPGVGGGTMPFLSVLFSRGPFDVARWVHPLPENGAVPGMPEWRWIHTPGHTPGHVSLWREYDRSLIVGDAFVTTKQESAYAAMTQRPEMHGPPMYFTQDFAEAEKSVKRLAALEPELVVPGHGRAMRGEALRNGLHTLAQNFPEVAVPEHGRYVDHPASVAEGSAYVEARH